MNAERLKQIEEIYHAVLEISPAERESFFKEHRDTDENLRREVESLLSFEKSSDSFLDTPPDSLAAEMFAEQGGQNDLTGKEIRHYKIIKILGKGGMGEVYLAEDTNLNRKVALKFLSIPLCGDKNFLRRFNQEAFAASALNHPNILTIYEFDAEGEVCFLAAEYIEGETLRETLRREKLTLRETLNIAEQTASALSAAHKAGIVHRDIKPENIMIRADGIVKVLDFGLAKLAENKRVNLDTEAETRQLFKTNPGALMGTAAYMSPEQARGKAVDARTDVWSLGVVLSEILAGQPPFAGETASDVIAAILKSEPAPFAENAPLELQRIVNKSLQKNADERYQTVKELLLDLRNLQRELELAETLERSNASAFAKSANFGASELSRSQNIVQSSAISAREDILPTTTSEKSFGGAVQKHKFAELVVSAMIVVTFLALVVAGIGYGIYRLTAKGDKPALPFQTAKFTRLTTTGKASGVAVSPDGKYVVHIQDDGGRQSLWTRQVATQSNVRIVAPAAVQYSGLTFSPDGNYIYYTAFSQELAQAVLFQAPTLGGAPKKLLENVTTSPVTFSPDGKQFAFVRPTPREEFTLMIANADGMEERKIVQYQNPPDSISAPAWSPDGKRIAYRLGNFESNDSSVYETQIADGATKPMTAQRWLNIGGLKWLADGSGLLMLATTGQQFVYQIWHLSYPQGEAHQLTNDLNNYLGMSLATDSNTLAVVQSEQQASIWVAPTSDSSRARPVTSGSGKADTFLSWTPDGRIVYGSNASGNDDIWITGADGAEAKQLTANARINQLPEVSPDGRYIVFLSYRTGVPHLWRMNIDGSNQRQLANSASGESSARFSPDGRWLVYRTALGRWTVWKMPADGSGEPVQLTDKYSRSPTVSPDGKLIAYFYREDNGPWRIAVAPFEGGEPLRTFDIPALPNPALRWTPNGRAIAYVDTRDGVSNILAQPLDGRKPKQLTDFKQERIFSFDYSRDGKQLALSRGTINNDVVLISNFK